MNERGCREEESALEYGMDFREPRYRREVFLRFYEFHLRHGTSPGCVYFLLPALASKFGDDAEARLWFAFINGNTQNPVTTWLIFRAFPDVHRLDPRKLAAWFRKNYERLAFDTDRRFHKKHFLECVESYRKLLAGRSQVDFFALHTDEDEEESFRRLWAFFTDHLRFFGRLSIFSYLEYLRIAGLPIACDQLFLEDLSGSKSHRNGLAKVLGRDDLDWHASNPSFDGTYPKGTLEWLAEEGQRLRQDALGRIRGPGAREVGYFTLESALCTYKSWHRPNRRYPNVYADMLVGRIRLAERTWGERLEVFWEARRASLPTALRLEDNPADPGVKPMKQNHYRLTGQSVMMHRDWPCFRNDFNDAIDRAQGKASA